MAWGYCSWELWWLIYIIWIYLWSFQIDSLLCEKNCQILKRFTRVRCQAQHQVILLDASKLDVKHKEKLRPHELAQWLLFSFQCNFVVMQLMPLATIMMESDTKFNQLFLQDFLIIRSSQNDVMQQKLFLIKQKSTILLHLSAALDVKFWTGKCYPECQDWSWNQEWLFSTINFF